MINPTNQFDLDSNSEELPGHVKVRLNQNLANTQDVQFFGVNQAGAPVSGEGVNAVQINQDNSEESTVLFNISNLVENGQFTDDTVEGVLTINGQEVGRKRLENNPNLYLG